MDLTELTVIRRLAAYLREAHQDELDNDHYGDGPEGCTYCAALAEADLFLKADV